MEEFKEKWTNGEGRECDIWVDTWGDIQANIHLGKDDKLADFYCAMDETCWQYANMDWTAPKNLINKSYFEFTLTDKSSDYGSYYNPYVRMSLFIEKSTNCKMVPIAEVPKANTWVETQYMIVCS
jgi:hypothetical protein